MKSFIRYFSIATLLLASTIVSADDFCRGYAKGYTAVYVLAVAKQPEEFTCPSQPAKDFGEQTDYAHGYEIGAVRGLADGYQQS